MVKGDLYLFGTPDPVQFFAGSFYSFNEQTITIFKPLIMRIVQNGSQVGLSATIPGEIIGVKPPFYVIHRIGVTYAHTLPAPMKDVYVKATSGIITASAGVTPKPFGGY
jgi:hypothetical protein